MRMLMGIDGINKNKEAIISINIYDELFRSM